MKNKILKATGLKKIMITLITVIVCLSAVGIYFAFDKIDTLAKEIKTEIDKTPILGVRTGNVQALAKLQNSIIKYQPISEQLNQLSTSSDNTKNQIMQDINAYASANNITISNYNFSGPTQPSGLNDPTVSSASLTTNEVIISFSNTIEYNRFLKFIKSIETNIPKMQIKNLSISKDQSSSNKIKVEPIKIEVYTR